MGPLERSVATLRVVGDDLVPSEMTAVLGVEPTHARSKGEPIARDSPSGAVARSGSWSLRATDSEPENLDAQVAELLGQLPVDLEVWRRVTSRYRVDLFCGWFLGSSNEGVEITPQTLVALGERGIALGLDIHAPDPVADV